MPFAFGKYVTLDDAISVLRNMATVYCTENF